MLLGRATRRPNVFVPRRFKSRHRLRKYFSPKTRLDMAAPVELRDPQQLYTGESIHPYPAEPPTEPIVKGKHVRDISDDWLTHKAADGLARRVDTVKNFHWKIGNAFDMEGLTELSGHVGRMDQDSSKMAVIFQAAKDEDFCPGADLLSLGRASHEERVAFYRLASETAYRMGTMKTTSMLHMQETGKASLSLQGQTYGLGAGLSIHPSYRLCDGSTQWAVPQVLHGAVPDMGMSWFLPRLKHELVSDSPGMFLALTGKRLESADVYHTGIATHFIEPDELRRFEQDTSRWTLGAEEKTSISNFAKSFSTYCKEIDETVPSAIGKYSKYINRNFNKTTLEDIFESLEKEDNRWGKNTLARLKKCSPLMLHLTFRLQRMGRYLESIEEAMELEFRVMQRVLKTKDWFEGIHARVASNRKPIWEHESIYDVPNELIESFFEPGEETLTLVPNSIGVHPARDPWWTRFLEADALERSPTEDYLVQRALANIIPRDQQNYKTLRALYREILRDSGAAEETAEFLGKVDMLYMRNPSADLNELYHRRGPEYDKLLPVDEHGDPHVTEEPPADVVAEGGGVLNHPTDPAPPKPETEEDEMFVEDKTDGRTYEMDGELPRLYGNNPRTEFGH